MANILLFDPNSQILDSYSASICGLGHEVVKTSSGAEALEYMDGVLFECVVADLSLVSDIRKKSQAPLVILGGTEAGSLQPHLDLPAVSGILKPCVPYDIAIAVQLSLASQRPKSYFRIPVSSITPGTITFDAFILKDGLFEKLHAKGEAISKEYCLGLTKSQNANFYTTLEGLDALIPENLKAAKKVVEQPQSTIQDSGTVLSRIVDLLAERVQFWGVDERTIDQTMQFLETFTKAVLPSQMIDVIESLEKHDKWIFSESLCSTAVSLMIAQKLSWSQTDLAKIGLAGFFHDIGKLQLPKALLKTPRPMMTMAQRLAYDKHPVLGKEFLESSGCVSPEICEIVYQHHEDNSGTGFPRHLTREAIHPIARLLRVADLFVTRVTPGHNRLAFTLEKSIESMAKEPGIELEYFACLKELASAGTAEKAQRQAKNSKA